MLRCVCCDAQLRTSEEIESGYCSKCQPHVRTVFDKDAFELGQTAVCKTTYTHLDWTTMIETDDYSDLLERYANYGREDEL